MNNVYRQLANLDFSMMLASAKAQTTSGANFLNNYRKYCMENAISCKLVNSFMNESRNYMYDEGVASCVKRLADAINEMKISWQIASVCESIDEDTRPSNFLARNAAQSAKHLLEMDEADVVRQINAGALKFAVHVPQFRHIAKCVHNDSMKYVEENVNYTTSNPISYIHRTDDNESYFNVFGRTFKMDAKGNVSECKFDDITFNTINQLLESNYVKLANDEMCIRINDVEFQISEANHVTRLAKNTELELDAAQLREYNALQLRNMVPSARANMAQMLEAVAKLVENYDNVAIVDCATVYTTNADKFIVIEGLNTCYAQLLQSTHASQWSINESITNTCAFIKEKTHVDLNDKYSKKIDEEINEKAQIEKQRLQEAQTENRKQNLAQRIEALTKQYRNNPAALAALAQAASELADC